MEPTWRAAGDTSCGASPLHRASFSGAVATMKLLMEHEANLMARDTSFGDDMTPLHKATAGGRHLAVQLLMDGLRRGGLLQAALEAIDSRGRNSFAGRLGIGSHAKRRAGKCTTMG